MRLKNSNISLKLLVPILTLIVFALGFATWNTNRQSKKAVIETAVISAKESITNFITLRSYYTKNII